MASVTNNGSKFKPRRYEINRFFALLATLVFAFTLLASGCGNKCDDLKDVCGKCSATIKAGCDFVVAADNKDACEAAIKTYEAAGCK